MSLVRATPHNSAGALPSQTHFHPNVRILVLSFYYFIRMYSRKFLFLRPYSLSIQFKRTYSRFLKIHTYIFEALSTSNVRIRALFYSYVRILALRAELLHTPFVSSWIPTRTSCMLSRSLHTPRQRFSFKSRWVSICRGLSVCLSVCLLKQSKILR